MPLAPRVARAIDLAIGERLDGPIFIEPDGRRLDRHAAGRIVRRVAHRAGITKRVGPHTLRHAFIPPKHRLTIKEDSIGRANTQVSPQRSCWREHHLRHFPDVLGVTSMVSRILPLHRAL